MSTTEHLGGAAVDAPRVVYIAGAKNCGSTMLDAILGNAPGARSLGEVGGFHRYSPGAPCACQLDACAVCPRVISKLAESGGVATYTEVSKQAIKERSAHWTLLATKGRRRYARLADVIFASTVSATGCRVLIDSSKNASRAAALIHDSAYDVRIIHVVRDGRGYLRSRARRATLDGKRHVAAVSMVSWLTKNVLIGTLLARRIDPEHYMICRYEDLMSNPSETLERLCAFAGLDPVGLVEAATGAGLAREQLFEPRRRVDYRWVHLDPNRLSAQRETGLRNAAFWFLGGFISARWGYDRQQSYLAPGS